MAAGLRPKLPKRWPPGLSALLTRCWAGSADERPEFALICAELEGMRAAALAALAAKQARKGKAERSEQEVLGAELLGALHSSGRAQNCVLA